MALTLFRLCGGAEVLVFQNAGRVAKIRLTCTILDRYFQNPCYTSPVTKFASPYCYLPGSLPPINVRTVDNKVPRCPNLKFSIKNSQYFILFDCLLPDCLFLHFVKHGEESEVFSATFFDGQHKNTSFSFFFLKEHPPFPKCFLWTVSRIDV